LGIVLMLVVSPMGSLMTGRDVAPSPDNSLVPSVTGAAAPAVDVPTAQVSSPVAKYQEGSAISESVDGWTYTPTGTPWGNWSFRNPQNVPAAAQLGYTGDGVKVALADTGIDFGAQNLEGKYMTYTNATIYSVTNKSVLDSAKVNQTFVSLGQQYIIAGSITIRVNETIVTNYVANYINGSVTFNAKLNFGANVKASYQHRSPYYGWPMAFDVYGLPQYLLAKEARSGGGGIANTTLNGTGPFDVNHAIKVDGKKDFSSTERASPDDKYGDVRANGSATGLEFDLTELWATRDDKFWYAGIQTRYGALNRTFGFAMDFDGAASGSAYDPRGNLLDFEASHSSQVEQVAYEPIHGLLASCAGKDSDPAVTNSYEYNSVKVWYANGTLIKSLPTEQTPVDSIAWSPDGHLLAYVTGRETVVYDTTTWAEKWRKTHSASGKTAFYRESLAFSPNGTMLMTGSISASNRVFILNVVTGETDNPLCSRDFTGSIAYSPNGLTIALGLANGRVQIINSSTYAELMLLRTYISPGVTDSKPIETVAWSPDGSQLVTGRQAGGYINLWNTTANSTWMENGYNLTGHGDFSSVNSIIWTASNIISGSNDGKIIYWNPTNFTLASTRNSRENSPVLSLALKQSTGEVFVATGDCTVRKYPSSWTSPTPFTAQKPDIIIYIDYEREYYKTVAGVKKLDKPDKIYDPEVYKWIQGTSSWMKTNMTNIFGKAFYKGSLGGEWTQEGFLEIALPRNFTAKPNENTLYLTSFICGRNPSRPQDTVPSDFNVPSPTSPAWVNLTGTKKTTLSAWAEVLIPKTTVNTSAIPSVSGKYHFGYHPSAALTNMLGPVPMIVVESTTKDVWDRVYVDMNTDYIIDSKDPYVDINNPLLVQDIWNLSSNGSVSSGPDGINDLSGGLLYFIGNGNTMMPYSARLTEILILAGVQLTAFSSENPMPIPGNGELVAFYGEFGFDEESGTMESHGTQMASVIAAEGLNQGVSGPIKGVSPDITFLPICNAQYDLSYALYFAVEGYDGKVNTGDEANIVSVGQYTSGYGSGLEETTQLIEYLVNLTGSSASFISPAGNDGSGYGTVAAPCGVSTLVVGFAEDNTYAAGSADQPQHFGDVSELSSRGPSAAGLAKPDVIAVGVGEVDKPLGATGMLSTSVGGKGQSTLWKASELATAVTTGVMALVFEAYKEKHGAYPSTQKAMDIIRSSAKDLGHDALTQGAGFVDALAAVRTARGDSGLLAGAGRTSFGTSFGTEYNSFINVLAPGESDTLPVQLTNAGTSSASALYGIEYMSRIDSQDTYKLVSSSTGAKQDISNMIPASAEVVKVTAQTNHTDFMVKEASYFMRLYDWVDSQPVGAANHGILDTADYLSLLTGVEYGYVNAMTCTVSNPHNTVVGKLVVEIIPDVGAGSTMQSKVWRITVESFASVPFNWLSISKTTGTLTGGGTDSIGVTASVPPTAEAGTYESSFVATYDQKTASSTHNIGINSMTETQYLNQVLHTTEWDDVTSAGNHWSDWTAPDSDANNIVDVPYSFNTMGKRDNFPLVNPIDTHPSAMILTPPITIASDADFATHAVRGDGSVGNPWIIENLDIDGSSYSQAGFSIANTADYFIVRNCAMRAAQSGSSGLLLNNVTHGTILDSEIYMNTGYGVQITGGSKNVLLDGVSVHDNSGNGIYIEGSSKVYLQDCDITANYLTGLYITYCTGVVVAGSAIHNQVQDGGLSFGTYMDYSTECVIQGNSIYGEIYGMYIMSSSNNRIYSNIFDGFDGSAGQFSIYVDAISDPTPPTKYNVFLGNDFINTVALHAYDDQSTAANIWNGNYWQDNSPYASPYAGINDGGTGSGVQDNSPQASPVAASRAYQTERAPIDINENINFTQANGVINPDAAGTPADPYIISGWSINTTGFKYGIVVRNTTAHFVIMDCLIYGNLSGLGIALENAPNGIVRSNRLLSLATGVLVAGTTKSTIYMNRMTGLTAGISVANSENSKVYYNYLAGGTHGIFLVDSKMCTVTRNEAIGNTANGIIIVRTQDSIVTYNSISSNGYGIRLENSTGYNAIYYNNLLGNVVQAYDDFDGDTLASYELYGSLGSPATLAEVYDVWSCNVTRGGVPLTMGVDYTIDNDTGLITFTPALVGWSGGTTIAIKALFTEILAGTLALPNDRLTVSAVDIDAWVIGFNGSLEAVPSGNFGVERRTGLIEVLTPVKVQSGIVIFANYTYYNRTCIVPITLNVYAAKSAAFEFGNMNTTATPSIMPVWGVRPGQGASLESGDRRYFYVKVPNQGMFTVTQLANFYLYTELKWALNQSDVNIVVYGKGGKTVFQNAAPYAMSKLGGSEEKADFSFFTSTNGPKDILVTPFNHEVLVICVSGKSFNGTGDSITEFEGRGGWLRLSDNAPKAWTNKMVGQTNISFQSNIDLPGAFASIVGPAAGTKSVESIYQDDLTLYDLSTLEGWLTMNAVAGFTKVVSVKNAMSWDVHIIGHPECADLDLAIFYDGLNGQPKDGIAQWQEIITKKDMKFDAYKSTYGTGTYCYCADADADEAIKIINPPDGDYIIKVLGFTVNSKPGYFDMEIKSIFAGVEGYKLTHADTEYGDENSTNGAYINTTTVDSFHTRTFNILWTFPEETLDGVYGGIFVLGVPAAQKLLVISADIILDRESPEIKSGITGPGTITPNRQPLITANVLDTIRGEISQNAEIFLDGKNVTNIADTSITLTTDSARGNGYWVGQLNLVPNAPLSDGGHYVEFVARDYAGNVDKIGWGFTVDTMAPRIDIPQSLMGRIVTAETEMRITGSTEPSADLKVYSGANLADVTMFADGTFTSTVPLINGDNEIRLIAKDSGGNVGVQTITIERDSTRPAMSSVISSTGSLTTDSTTVISGKVNLLGTLRMNGKLVDIMPSDKTFESLVALSEGQNVIKMEFTDLKGFKAFAWKNVTKDTTAPEIRVTTPAPFIREEVYIITGTMVGGTSVYVNGKPTTLVGERFSKNVTLSYGANTVVVEGRDAAGNSVFRTVSISYLPEPGTNWAAIGLMVGLLIVGLVVGILFVRKTGPKGETEEPAKSEEEDATPAVEPEEPNQPEEPAENLNMDGYRRPVAQAGPELMPLESAYGQPAAESELTVPSDEEATSELPPIPAEEAMPEELPAPEPIPEPVKAAPVPVTQAAAKAPIANEEKISRLKKALADGKISQEMYDLNIKKLQG
jgi:parallel beta-helix repeat protein